MKKFLSIILCVALLVTMSTFSVSAESMCPDDISVVALTSEDSINGQVFLCSKCGIGNVTRHTEIVYQSTNIICMHGKSGYDIATIAGERVYTVCDYCFANTEISTVYDPTVILVQCKGY